MGKNFSQKILKVMDSNLPLVLTAMLIVTAADIVLLKDYSLSVFVFILCGWLLLLNFYKKVAEQHITTFIIVAFAFVILFQTLGATKILEKTATWTYILLIVYLFYLMKNYDNET